LARFVLFLTDIASLETILPKIDDFVWQRDANPAYFVGKTSWRGNQKDWVRARKDFGEDPARFPPSINITKIDINNDGIAEKVIAQRFYGNGALLFVVNDDVSDLDYEKTRLLFRHQGRKELGILRPYLSEEWKLPPSVGSQENTIVDDSLHSASYGIFSYEGKIYFDLWWDSPVISIQNGHISDLNDETKRLHVFIAEKNHVTEICTYKYLR
jgi:hypothetical protein